MEVVKDNPSDYLHAFCQMVHALKYLRGDIPDFAVDTYDFDAIEPYRNEIETILARRQLSAEDDWKAFGERLSGCAIEDFDIEKYQLDYWNASDEEKFQTFLGKFILAALAQKSMVTNSIYTSGNKLAGVSVDYNEKGFRGIKDFAQLVSHTEENGADTSGQDTTMDGGDES